MARSVRPVIAIRVGVIFGAFMALAHFVFGSPEAVKALAVAGVGGVASLLPSIAARLEYRLSDAGIAKRPVSRGSPREFKDVFLWAELSHLVPTSSGFKYYKKLDESRPFVRAFKLHVLGDWSGELHVEREDLEQVRALLASRGAPVLGSPGAGAPPEDEG